VPIVADEDTLRVVAVKEETVGEPEGLIWSCPLALKTRVELSIDGIWLSFVRLPI
jgi:hypothetical protein